MQIGGHTRGHQSQEVRLHPSHACYLSSDRRRTESVSHMLDWRKVRRNYRTGREGNVGMELAYDRLKGDYVHFLFKEVSSVILQGERKDLCAVTHFVATK